MAEQQKPALIDELAYFPPPKPSFSDKHGAKLILTIFFIVLILLPIVDGCNR